MLPAEALPELAAAAEAVPERPELAAAAKALPELAELAAASDVESQPLLARLLGSTESEESPLDRFRASLLAASAGADTDVDES